MVWVKYGLLTLGRPSVRCYSTLWAWSPVCGSTLRVSHVRHCFGPVSDFAVLKNNLSLLEGLEFTPLSSAKSRTKGDIYVPGTYWYVYQHFLFDFPFDEICVRLLFFTLRGVLFTSE